MSLLPVDEALARLLDGVDCLDAETLPFDKAAFRVLAEDLKARRTQPPSDVSAMDGYAVRAADIAALPATLTVIGESAAGNGFAGDIHAGEAVRIFTGAPVPPGTDTILLQEDARPAGDGRVEAMESTQAGRHIRKKGLDFANGDIVLARGRILEPAALALAAAADHPLLSVIRKPRVAILMTGDELVAPGGPRTDDQIVASNGYGIAAMAAADGADVTRLELVPDDRAALAAAVHRARDDADILITIGGASVGDHDLVNEVLRNAGVIFDFWKIAMRPGKPLMVGRLGSVNVLGLPGNPVSSFVCAHLFLRPLIARMAGRPYRAPLRKAVLATGLRPNDHRRDYIRARLEETSTGLVATPFGLQDSSMLRVLADSDALIVREPFAPAASAGDSCMVHLLRQA